MEPQCRSLQLLFSLLINVIIMVLNRIRERCKTCRRSSDLPPGPWKLPILGNIHQLVGSLPHRGLRDLAKKHGPLVHIRLGQLSTVVVSSAEFAKVVLKTHDVIFASRPQVLITRIMYGPDIAFAPYGDYWRRLRKICKEELLSTKRVQSYRPIREEEVVSLIEWITTTCASKAGTTSPINLTEKIYSLTFSIISRAAFGKKRKDEQDFICIVKELSEASAGFALEDVFPSFKLLHIISGLRPKVDRLKIQIDRILENIIENHIQDMSTSSTPKNASEEDLVDVLLKFHDINGCGGEFSLTTDNIKAVILDIFGAGSETSATTVDWAMSEMIKQPRIMKKAQDEVREVFNRKQEVNETCIREIKYLKLVIKETLRLHPAAPLLIPRECRERCEIGGYEIPAKTKIIVNGWAIGRDPKYWTEPDTFNPERFLDSTMDYHGTNFEYIPFGAGRRICPGISYGLANVELPLAFLLYHFDWKLPNGIKNEDLDMTEDFGVTVRRKQHLRLIPVPYHPPFSFA